jgi:ethanolamine-phosphate cytidylyltransferase
MQIVYTAGAFDLMHPGHVDFLEAAKNEGSYLIVGLYEDSVVNKYKGSHYPVQKLQERVLSVLANKLVADAATDAPISLGSCFTSDHSKKPNFYLLGLGLLGEKKMAR